MAKKERALSEQCTFRILLTASLLFSLGGVALAVATKNYQLGNQGGIIGVTIAFFSFLATRPYGDDFLKTFGKDVNSLIKKIKGTSTTTDCGMETKIEEIEERLDEAARTLEALQGKIFIDELGQTRQNFYIAWAGGLSTIFSGFGDPMARYISSLL